MTPQQVKSRLAAFDKRISCILDRLTIAQERAAASLTTMHVNRVCVLTSQLLDELEKRATLVRIANHLFGKHHYQTITFH